MPPLKNVALHSYVSTMADAASNTPFIDRVRWRRARDNELPDAIDTLMQEPNAEQRFLKFKALPEHIRTQILGETREGAPEFTGHPAATGAMLDDFWDRCEQDGLLAGSDDEDSHSDSSGRFSERSWKTLRCIARRQHNEVHETKYRLQNLEDTWRVEKEVLQAALEHVALQRRPDLTDPLPSPADLKAWTALILTAWSQTPLRPLSSSPPRVTDNEDSD